MGAGLVDLDLLADHGVAAACRSASKSTLCGIACAACQCGTFVAPAIVLPSLLRCVAAFLP
ncbi:MAG: hypothetical protein RIQ60_563 [Pseudomonadota bacterium]|jgi:hypothetical protein